MAGIHDNGFPGFLLKQNDGGKGWPTAGGIRGDDVPYDPQDIARASKDGLIAMPQPAYLSETADYAVLTLDVKSDAIRDGWEPLYIVIHKTDRVILDTFRLLAIAVGASKAAQQTLDNLAQQGKQEAQLDAALVTEPT